MRINPDRQLSGDIDSARPGAILGGFLLAGSLIFLIWLAWQALSGGFRQLPRSRTVGQKVETVVQVESGILSLLVGLTCFWGRRWAGLVRYLWGISLASAAGLSALVWGPRMPLVGALFAGIALLVVRVVIWALQTEPAP